MRQPRTQEKEAKRAPDVRGKWVRLGFWAVLLPMAALLASSAAQAPSSGPCSETALAGFSACKDGVRADYFQKVGVCVNEPEDEDREECLSEARDERAEGFGLCLEQLEARRALCERLGEEPYAPEFEPEDFESDFTNPGHPNPYWPLAIGNHWSYEGGGERIEVEVLPKTKLIEGVTCVVVNDRVEEDGQVVEDTDDWYALSKEGTVYYCGEISREFEHFEGDNPEEPELVGIEGSWKAGRDGQQPGIVMQAQPTPGQIYRQEWAFLDAEDVAEVLSVSYAPGKDDELDEHVPLDLAGALCHGDCVVTRETTPIEPDASERKYYAPGIGLFLEVDEERGDVVRLVGCNVHPACGTLPAP